MSVCIQCGREIIPLDIAYTKKLLGRGVEEYTCTECLRVAFGFSEAQMQALADRWRAAGCTLFPRETESPA